MNVGIGYSKYFYRSGCFAKTCWYKPSVHSIFHNRLPMTILVRSTVLCPEIKHFKCVWNRRILRPIALNLKCLWHFSTLYTKQLSICVKLVVLYGIASCSLWSQNNSEFCQMKFSGISGQFPSITLRRECHASLVDSVLGY